MQVDDALIDRLSRLSMLHFEAAEREEIKNDLEKMILFMDKIKELDLEGVEPLLHMSSNQDVLREDIPAPPISREEALAHAKLHDGAGFKAPKTIDKSGS